jgi:hypothetical protein
LINHSSVLEGASMRARRPICIKVKARGKNKRGRKKKEEAAAREEGGNNREAVSSKD